LQALPGCGAADATDTTPTATQTTATATARRLLTLDTKNFSPPTPCSVPNPARKL
jgi:hypothetical protein